MVLTKEDNVKLNYLAHGNGALAIEYLAHLLWEYYSKETVFCSQNQREKNSGKAELAHWLKSLPKGLQDGVNVSIPTGV